jgi:hypothetical protein
MDLAYAEEIMKTPVYGQHLINLNALCSMTNTGEHKWQWLANVMCRFRELGANIN